MNGDVRIDPHLGTVVHIVGSRQRRPNLPHDGCPFCVGGREAPEPYSVRSFPNRWPALGEGRCEVVLYTPDHDASFASLGVDGVRAVIDLWAQRTAALRAEPGVNYVLIFENRGAEVGATISHPHGQIYAFDHVPDRQARLLKAGWTPDHDPGDREVLVANDWTVVVPHAPIHPVSIDIAPRRQVGDLVSLSEVELDGLAAVLVDVMSRLDRFYERDLPYMLWINQAPVNWSDGPPAWLRIEIVSPWRSAGLSRFIAAAEVATGEYFNPVEPSEVARRLREFA
jgi:UDPglucose--hexose-1-phosphate uridylyltransferase